MPTRVVAVGDGWAAIRQSVLGADLDAAPLQVIFHHDRRDPVVVTVDDVVATTPEGEPVAVVGDRLLIGGTGQSLGPVAIDGVPRTIIQTSKVLWVGGGPSLVRVNDHGRIELIDLPDAATSIARLGEALLVTLPDATIVVSAEGRVSEPDSPERFATSRRMLTFGDRGLKIGNQLVPYSCRAVLAVLDAPLRIAARCESGDLILRGDRDYEASYAADLPVDLEEHFDEAPIEEPPFAQTVRTGRIWCDDGDCIDLISGRTIDEPPFWTNDLLALTVEDHHLVALDLELGWRWGVTGSPWIHEAETPRVLAEAGEIVVIGNQVIDVGEHRVVSEGPWAIHGVEANGTVYVTDPVEGASWTMGPVRRIEPGAEDKHQDEDEDEDEDDED